MEMRPRVPGETMPRRAFLQSSVLALVASTGFRACGSPSQRNDSIRDVPWLGELEQRGGALPEGTPPLHPLLTDSSGQPITSRSAWERRREELRAVWLDYLGPLPPNSNPPRLEVLEEDRPDGVIRQLVAYEGEPGITVQGYLLRPAEVRDRRPAVLALHSTANETIRQPAGVEGAPEKAFALDLARQGFVAFCPMCFLWHDRGERSYEEQTERFMQRHPGSTGMAKMLFDAQRGLDVLESLGDVDPNRIGIIGHSLGGKEVLYLAAFDSRVRAVVSSEGGIGTGHSNWDAPWYLGEGMRAFGREHHELLGLIAPRPFLLVGGNSADGEHSLPFIEAALPVYDLYGKPHRVGLLNHRQGHSMPPIAQQRSYEWLKTYV